MPDDLIKGLAEFKLYQYAEDSSLMNQLAKEGQSPRYFIISCIDSRCNPGTIFRAKPGTFFAHKAMGAIVRPYKEGTALSAALQFALEYNQVEVVIVLGHTQCGAVQALANNIDDPEISSFISVAKHAHEAAEACCNNHDDVLAQTEKNVVMESVENLKAYPSVSKALSEKRIQIKPWIFDMSSGDLLEYSETTKDFEAINTNIDITEDSRKNA